MKLTPLPIFHMKLPYGLKKLNIPDKQFGAHMVLFMLLFFLPIRSDCELIVWQELQKQNRIKVLK